jgi:MoxR-like ATPase
MTDAADCYDALEEEVSSVLVAMDEEVRNLTVALLTRGHVLLEGVPGVAKTTLANVFAEASGLSYNRIQMTPDILPADITGTSVYREHTGEFELQRGPVFSNVVVADEINRATPKTQSALLEAMEEEHVSIEGETLDLPEPFLVIATQNPIEMEGTFELPEAQRDRFQLKLTVAIPDRAGERELFDRLHENPTMGAADVEQVIEPADLLAAREEVVDVFVRDVIREYILDVVAATREHPDVAHGASPRAMSAFLNTAKARAAIEDRDYVVPLDVKEMAGPILQHRLVLTSDAELGDVSAADVVADVMADVTPPSSRDSEERAAAAAAEFGPPSAE